MAREARVRTLTTGSGLMVHYSCPKWSEIQEERENQVDWLVRNYVTKVTDVETEEDLDLDDLYADEFLEIHDNMMRGYSQVF